MSATADHARPHVANESDEPAPVMPWAATLRHDTTMQDFYDKLRSDAENESGNVTFESSEQTEWANMFRSNNVNGWKVFLDFMARHFQLVRSWNLQPRDTKATDRVAVLHFATGVKLTDNETLDKYEFSVRTTMHQLGKEWGIQIFYTNKVNA